MTSWDRRRRLLIDLETFSSVEIAKAGAFKYMEAPDFEILLLAYAWDDGPVQVLDLTDPDSESALRDLLPSIQDPEVVKVAHNSAFERAALSRYLGGALPPEEWEDTMVLAAYNGLPLSLDAAGAALQLRDQKIKEGTSLITYFCKPCKPTIANSGRTRNLPKHAPDKWERFIEYCRRDVEVEQAIYYRLRSYPVTDLERRIWAMDARINERGVPVDIELAESAIAVDETAKAVHTAEMQQLTGLENPNSVAQIKDWLLSVGVGVENLNKATVTSMIETTPNPTVRRVLELRRLLGKTSTKKYQAMLAAAGQDNRVRGLLQYYGASRTGRWAGRLVQLQNLPQNHLPDIGRVRQLVKERDLETLELVYDNVADVLSQLIRTAFTASPGHTLLVADYSAIEARVIAYLAGEKWRLDVFAGDGKIYEASYAQAFGVPIESVKKGSPERQQGKVMELGLGYGMGTDRFVGYAAERGLTIERAEAENLIQRWRAASPNIPGLWRSVEKAAKAALQTPGTTKKVHRKAYDPARAAENEAITGGRGYSPYFNAGLVCTYRKDKDALRCTLPSGRVLTYWGARLDDEGSIVFMGQNQTTKKWKKDKTWGGKLVENIVQATARDCLAVAMLRLEDAGYKILFSVHDEIIAEESENGRSWQDMAEAMGQPIEWAPGLLLRADGYSTPFYMKD